MKTGRASPRGTPAACSPAPCWPPACSPPRARRRARRSPRRSAHGVLTVFGDSLDNTITISRNAAGKILVNGGAVAVIGGTPTVANTSQIQVFGLGGNDVITLNQANGALPAAQPVRRRRQRHAHRRLRRRPAVRPGRQRHAAR